VGGFVEILFYLIQQLCSVPTDIMMGV